MAVTKIQFVEEVDNEPEAMNGYGELSQGETYTNYKIYRLINDDGTEQYMKVGIVYNSYSDPSDIAHPTLAKQETKTVTVWR